MKKISIPVILVLLICLLTGCSSQTREYPEEYGYAVAETMAAAAYDTGYVDGAYDAFSYTEEEFASEKMAVSAGGTTESGSGESVTPEQTERKLIRTINITLQTEEFDTVANGIIADVEKFGGYIESSNYYLGGYYEKSNRSANICIRIPADKCDEFLSKSYEKTYVECRDETTEDVSLRYSDLETRLSTLEAERDRLQELIKEADDMESIVVLEQRLSEIRYELESIHSSLKNYDNKVDYATVWLYVYEVKKAEPAAEASVGERIRDGFARSTEDLGDALTDFAVWFVSNILTILFVLVLIGAQVLIVLAIVRGAKKRNLAKKAKRNKQVESNNGKEEVSKPEKEETQEDKSAEK